MRRGVVILAVAMAGCGGGDGDGRSRESDRPRAQVRCPQAPEEPLSSLSEMREAARAQEGPADLRRNLRELAATAADDWLTREDLLADIAAGGDCARERRLLSAALRVPHYRYVARRAGHGHALRPHKLHSDQVSYDGLLHFALYQYRQALDGSLGDLQGVRPPAPAEREHRRYLRRLRALNRFAARMEQLLQTTPQKAFALRPRLPALARTAEQAHADLMRATIR